MQIHKVVPALGTLVVLAALMGAAAEPGEEWAAHYGGLGQRRDVPTAMTVDSDGNVFVTGESDGGSRTKSDYATIKYAPTGAKLWEARFDGTFHDLDVARAITVDAVGNCYVTGESYSGLHTHGDCVTIKYDAAGHAVWTRTFNGTGNAADAGTAIAVDKDGSVYVAGETYSGTSAYTDFMTLKYNKDGRQLWVKTYNGEGNSVDHASGLVLDDTGNIYVTGYSYNGKEKDMDFATIKYSPTGETLWVKTYNGPDSRADIATAIALDGKGGVYVAGGSYRNASQMDFCTIKYSADGDELWVKRYNGPGNKTDIVNVLKVDHEGNVVVAGHSEGEVGHGLDYAVVKYSPEGAELWTARYNGPGSAEDKPTALAIDSANNIYVTGYSDGGPGFGLDYATLKFDPDGNQLWVKRYNGPYKDIDVATCIGLGPNNEVYVTGYSTFNNNRVRYTTLKYSGDTNEDGR